MPSTGMQSTVEALLPLEGPPPATGTKGWMGAEGAGLARMTSPSLQEGGQRRCRQGYHSGASGCVSDINMRCWWPQPQVVSVHSWSSGAMVVQHPSVVI